jgi:heme/copper-type cytochrome/quinol oxidase subunit 2
MKPSIDRIVMNYIRSNIVVIPVIPQQQQQQQHQRKRVLLLLLLVVVVVIIVDVFVQPMIRDTSLRNIDVRPPEVGRLVPLAVVAVMIIIS